MSGTSHLPRIQMPESPAITERFASSHAQYTSLGDNSLGQERVASGFHPNGDLTGFSLAYCPEAAASCPAADATYLRFDTNDVAIGAQTQVGEDTIGGALDPTFSSTDTAEHVGLKAQLNAAKTTGADKVGGQASLAASLKRDGTLVEQPDGRFLVSGGRSVSGEVAAGTGLGFLQAQGAGGGAAGERSARYFEAEEVEAARRRVAAHHPDIPAERVSSLELTDELLASEESAADFEVGESRESFRKGHVKAGGEVTAAVVAGGGYGLSTGDATSFTRTEAGLVIRHTVSSGSSSELRYGGGIPGAKARRTATEEVSATATLTLVLDPDTDRDLIRRLEGLSGDALEQELRTQGAAVQRGGSETEALTDTLQLTLAARKASSTGTFSYTDDGFEGTATDSVKGQATFYEHDFGSTVGRAAYEDGAGLSLSLTEDKRQLLGRAVADEDLAALAQLTATSPAAFEREGTPDRVGEPVAWQALRDELQRIATLPEGEQARSTSEAIARFVAEGQDVVQLDRVFDANGLGHVEQWPASVPRGAERLAWLAGQEAPTPETLTELDALRIEVASASDFTVPTARAETLERIGAIRDTLLAGVLAHDGVDAEDLAFDATHAALATAIARCAAYRADEGTMYAGVGTEDNLFAYERLQRFYADWGNAVDAVRGVCGELQLPKEAWMVSMDGVDRVEAYEPTLERARRLHAEHGGMAGDFVREFAERF